MSIRVALYHRTSYEYDRPVRLGPQVVRLAEEFPFAYTREQAEALVPNWITEPLTPRVRSVVEGLRARDKERTVGPTHDFTDLHAWAEVYLPGAGWVGLEPSVTKPYTEAQWAAIDALGSQVDAVLDTEDGRLTMGREPTFVSIDFPDAAEWNTDADGPTKSERAEVSLRLLNARTMPGALMHFGQGKWHPGEPLPRWAYGCLGRIDGRPLWRDTTLVADRPWDADYPGKPGSADVDVEAFHRAPLEAPRKLKSAPGIIRTTLCVEPRNGMLHVCIPPICLFVPRLQHFSITPHPGVIEVNVRPSRSWHEFRPDLLRSLIASFHDHPSLSYSFSGLFIGPTSQAPRIDEARPDYVHELEVAFRQIPERGQYIPPWLVDRLFRHLLTDVTGNTHRAEFWIDKLYSAEGATGRLGLLEVRGFEMPPHSRMSVPAEAAALGHHPARQAHAPALRPARLRRGPGRTRGRGLQVRPGVVRAALRVPLPAHRARKIPLHGTGREGEQMAGVRFRAWQPPECVHPTIGVHSPLVFDVVDTWTGRSIGGCTYNVMHPGGRNCETRPVNALEAEARRKSRFSPFGHTPGPLVVRDEKPTLEFPFTLDLRHSCLGEHADVRGARASVVEPDICRGR